VALSRPSFSFYARGGKVPEYSPALALENGLVTCHLKPTYHGLDTVMEGRCAKFQKWV
jgi:hypothetical protein